MARLTIMTTPFRPNYIPDTQIAPLFTSPLFSLATPTLGLEAWMVTIITPALNLKLIKTVRKKKKKRLVILHHQENEGIFSPPPVKVGFIYFGERYTFFRFFYPFIYLIEKLLKVESNGR